MRILSFFFRTWKIVTDDRFEFHRIFAELADGRRVHDEGAQEVHVVHKGLVEQAGQDAQGVNVPSLCPGVDES